MHYARHNFVQCAAKSFLCSCRFCCCCVYASCLYAGGTGGAFLKIHHSSIYAIVAATTSHHHHHICHTQNELHDHRQIRECHKCVVYRRRWCAFSMARESARFICTRACVQFALLLLLLFLFLGHTLETPSAGCLVWLPGLAACGHNTFFTI